MCIKATRKTTHPHTHSLTHTRTHSITTGINARTRDHYGVNCAALHCLGWLRAVVRTEEFFLWGWAPAATGNGPTHIEQAVHSHSSVQHISLCVPSFQGCSAIVHGCAPTAVSPSRRCRVACTTERPETLMGSTGGVRQTNRTGRQCVKNKSQTKTSTSVLYLHFHSFKLLSTQCRKGSWSTVRFFLSLRIKKQKHLWKTGRDYSNNETKKRNFNVKFSAIVWLYKWLIIF